MIRKPVWRQHPHVRSGAELTIGERAADVLKHWFGTWTILGVVLGGMTFWLRFIRDPGHLNLNLTLSCIAAVQGIILQISANRGDRISSEVAASTHSNSELLLSINEDQSAILSRLAKLEQLPDDVAGLAQAVRALTAPRR